MMPSPTPFAQIGWATGPAHLVAAIAKAHQFVAFCVPSNLQRAVAYGLTKERWFYRLWFKLYWVSASVSASASVPGHP